MYDQNRSIKLDHHLDDTQDRFFDPPEVPKFDTDTDLDEQIEEIVQNCFMQDLSTAQLDSQAHDETRCIECQILINNGQYCRICFDHIFGEGD